MDKLDTKKKTALGILVIGLAFGAGFFSRPAKVKTEIKEVVKTVTVKEEAASKIVYKEKIVYKDGTVKEIERTDESTSSKESSASESTKLAKSETTRDSGLTLQALAIIDTTDIQGKREYGLYAKKRIVSNVSVGLLVTSDKKVGLGLGVDF